MANFIKWWPAFRFDKEVKFHNQMLLLDQLNGPFDLNDPYRHIPRYETNEDGDEISEWSVPLADLEGFLDRLTTN